MTGIATITIIQWCTDNNRCSVGRYAHRRTKIIKCCFTVNIQSKLSITFHICIEIVYTNMTRIGTIVRIGFRTHDKSGTICRYADSCTKIIKCCFSINIRSNLFKTIASGIEFENADMTGQDTVIIIEWRTDHNCCTV